MLGARPKHLRVRPRAIGRPSPFSCRRSQDGAGSCGIRSGDGPGGHDHWVIAAGKDRVQHSDMVRRRRRRRLQRDAALAPRRFRRLTDLSAEGCWKQPRTVGLRGCDPGNALKRSDLRAADRLLDWPRRQWHLCDASSDDAQACPDVFVKRGDHGRKPREPVTFEKLRRSQVGASSASEMAP
jgi:hypothetical protein